jgi:hypothetical protein
MTFVTNLKNRLLGVVAMALVLAAVQAGQANDRPSRVVGVAVGHADINHDGKMIDSGAQGAEQMATAFRKLPNAVVVSRTGKEATRQNILELLDLTAEVVHEGDVVPVYVCAHGHLDFQGEWEFAPSDGQLIRAAELQARLAKIAARGTTVILILDSCHAGGAEKAFRRPLLGGGPVGTILVLAGCGPEQTCKVGPSVGSYTQAILEALSGLADFNGDGRLEVSELIRYVERRLPQLLEELRSKTRAEVDRRSDEAFQDALRLMPDLAGEWKKLQDDNAPESERTAFKARALERFKVFLDRFYEQTPTIFGDRTSTGLFLSALPQSETDPSRPQWAMAA